jgi:hypothetical protein
MLSNPKRWMAAAFTALAILGAGTGIATARHHKHHGIPQHNGGDHDADNNGGPSDGDGRI